MNVLYAIEYAISRVFNLDAMLLVVAMYVCRTVLQHKFLYVSSSCTDIICNFYCEIYFDIHVLYVSVLYRVYVKLYVELRLLSILTTEIMKAFENKLIVFFMICLYVLQRSGRRRFPLVICVIFFFIEVLIEILCSTIDVKNRINARNLWFS